LFSTPTPIDDEKNVGYFKGKWKETSSNVQLKRFELAADGIATWTSRCPATGVLADENVYAILAEAADAL
jgi:hypothetical protein